MHKSKMNKFAVIAALFLDKNECIKEQVNKKYLLME